MSFNAREYFRVIRRPAWLRVLVNGVFVYGSVRDLGCPAHIQLTMAIHMVDLAPILQRVNYSIYDDPYSALPASDTGTPVLPNLTGAELPMDPCTQSLPDDYFDVWRDVKFWSLAFIIPVGLVFNCISLGVFMTSWMRHVVPGRYFMALALADNLVLLGELLLWLNTKDFHRGPKLGLEFHHSVDFLCKAINFLRYGARMWSSWLTVAITIERFLSVIFPFKMVRLSSPTKAIIVISTIGVICFSLACFTFFTLEAKPYRGSPLCQYSDRIMYSLWLVVVIAGIGEMVLPSVIVTIFTVLIIWKLTAARRERIRMRNGNGHGTSGWRQKASDVQPTIALIAIAIMFISIRMPYVIMFFVNEYKKVIWRCLDKWLSLKIYVLYTIAMVLAVLNYALNFCLYCVAGTAFRTELRRCMTNRQPNRYLARAGIVSRARDSVFSRGGGSSNISPRGSFSAHHPHYFKGTVTNMSLGGAQCFSAGRLRPEGSPKHWTDRDRTPSKSLVVRHATSGSKRSRDMAIGLSQSDCVLHRHSVQKDDLDLYGSMSTTNAKHWNYRSREAVSENDQFDLEMAVFNAENARKNSLLECRNLVVTTSPKADLLVTDDPSRQTGPGEITKLGNVHYKRRN